MSQRKMLEEIIAGDRSPPPVGELLGLQLTEVDEGRARFRMEAKPEHANPMGTLHGGIVCDLADAAMGCAFATILGEGESFTTVELKANFLRPFWTGELVAQAEVLQAGRKLGLVECTVRDAEGNRVAHVTSTCMRLAGEDATGR